MPTVLGVNHVALRISDVARAQEFYGKILGLEVVHVPAHLVDPDRQKKFREVVASSKGVPAPTAGIWFAAGNTQLHLIVTRGTPKALGAHLDDISRLKCRISKRQSTRSTKPESSFLEAPNPMNTRRQLWLSDPGRKHFRTYGGQVAPTAGVARGTEYLK